MKPRKTQNPWDEVMNPDLVLNQSRARTWDDGYKCGHSDAEMDARDQIDTLLEDTAYLKRQTDNLVEKNDNQVKIIKGLTDTADWQKSIIESHERAYASQRDKIDRLKAEIADEKRIVRLFAEDKRLLADEVKRLTKDNSARGNSILDAQAKIRELEANVTYYQGMNAAKKEAYGQGVDAAVTEIVTHMQSMGGTVKFLTAEQYSQLEDINANIGAKTGGIENNAIVIEEQVTLLGEVLGDIECPPR